MTAVNHAIMSYRNAKMELFLSDARGVYIPRDFAQFIRRDRTTGISDDDYKILEEGPDHEWYWEAWEDVCNNARITDTDGTVYTVYQDGDCWLIEDGAQLNDRDCGLGEDVTDCSDMFVIDEGEQS
jgi:hypothetical protein